LPTHGSRERETASASAATVEDALSLVWRETLGVERVGRSDGFLALGGHSLRAMVIARRVRETFGVSVSMREILERDAFAEQVRLIEERRGNGGHGPSRPPPPPAPAGESPVPARPPGADSPGGLPPLTRGEEQFWFLARSDPESPTYHEPFAFRLRGPLDVERLEACLHALVRRHDVLRTRYPESGGRPVRVVEPEDASRRILRRVPGEAGDVAALLSSEARRPFDLAADPPFRVTCVRERDDVHVLLFVFHHVACDLWTVRSLFREIDALYAGAAPLPPPPTTLAEIALRQRSPEVAAEEERQLAHWRETLAGAPAELDLVPDRPRPVAVDTKGAVRRFQLPPAVVRGLRDLGRAQGASLFMVAMAAFDVLLLRYTRQEDLVVGTPIATRHGPGEQDVAGCLLNTLAVRTRLSGDPTFRDVLGRVRAALLDAYAHPDVAFPRLVEALRPARSAALHPLFQVAFVLQDGPAPLVRLGVLAEPVPVATGTSKWDLTLFLEEAEDGLAGRLEYATALFDDSTADRIVAHFEAVLEDVLADPDRPVSRLPLLRAPERDLVLRAWNATERPYPRERRIDELFAEQVARDPDAPALACGGTRWTYRALDERAGRLARALRAAGVERGARVGVALDRSPEYVLAVLAVLRAGGAYVPIDLAYPRERTRSMIEDAGVTVVLSAASRPLADAQVREIHVDARALGEAAEGTPDPGPPGDASDAAYVLYTSGSTGVPKGVSVPHRGVVRLVRGATFADLGPGERHLALAPPTFDASTFEIWGPLLNGGTCVVHPERDPDLDAVARTIREHGVTCLWLTSTLFNTVVDVAPETIEDVRHVLVGGEALSVPHVRRALERLPRTRLTNGYGPTENTTFTCTHEIPRTLPQVLRSIPIGRPIANTRVYLLDAHRQPVPVGVPGELWTGGDGLAHGYVGRPDLTAERFIPVSLAGGDPERLYRTGDLCRWLPDGTIEYLGRLDAQVKVRGYRIEPGEVEAALGKHPDVGQCAVVARGEGIGRRLVAHVAAPARRPAPEELRRHLGGLLPSYMVPAEFVVHDRLPTTSSGKVDRSALPDPPAHVPAVVSPMGDRERALAEVWATVLGVDSVGPDDDFFEAGGHSLLAVRLLAEVNERFGTSLSLSRIFSAPTVREMAVELDAEPAGRGHEGSVELRRGDGGVPLFCVPGLGGHPIDFVPLVRHLGRDEPVHGLVYPGYHGEILPPTTIEEIARRMLHRVREVQSVGPYRVAGYSLGGLVAYEMARQLVAVGEAVSMLAVWDTYPGRPTRLPLLRRLGLHARRFVRESPGGKVRYLFARARRLLGRVFRRGGGARSAPRTWALERGSAWFEVNRRVWVSCRAAADAYHPGPYPGRLLLCRSDRRDWDEFLLDDPYLRWDRLAEGGVIRRAVEAAHLKILKEPYVGRLGEIMREHLAAVAEGPDVPS
jgi:amino acid adenylation domain-containing protein